LEQGLDDDDEEEETLLRNCRNFLFDALEEGKMSSISLCIAFLSVVFFFFLRVFSLVLYLLTPPRYIKKCYIRHRKKKLLGRRKKKIAATLYARLSTTLNVSHCGNLQQQIILHYIICLFVVVVR